MSTSKVWVTTIENVQPHKNADALDVGIVKGWQVVIKKGQYQNGDKVVYFEQGTVLPLETSEVFGVTNYLSQKTDIKGDKVGVVHRVKLRGEPSFGLVIPLPNDLQADLGDDVSSHYGAYKYDPPLRVGVSNTLPEHPMFPPYTDIENLRTYGSLFQDGEQVVIMEKIHGTNSRIGFVQDDDGNAHYFAGSRKWRRQEPDKWNSDTYWFPHTLPSVDNLLSTLEDEHTAVILYGEVYGKGVQSYQYGQHGLAYRAFDLMIDGKFIDYDKFQELTALYGVPIAPIDYVGEYSLEKVKQLSEIASCLGNPQGREGVVVRPTKERTDPTIGRVILKYVADSYLFGKASEQDTTDA